MNQDLRSRSDADHDPAIGAALWRAYAVRVDLDAAARHLWRIHRAAGLGSRPGAAAGLRRLTVAVLTAMMLVTSSGVAVGASRSIPGDFLYALKRGVERAQLLVARSPEDVAQLHLRFARERMQEAQVAARVRPGSVPGLVSDALGALEQAQRLGGAGTAQAPRPASAETKARVLGAEVVEPRTAGQPPAPAASPPSPPGPPPSPPAPEPAAPPPPETATATVDPAGAVAPDPQPAPAAPDPKGSDGEHTPSGAAAPDRSADQRTADFSQAADRPLDDRGRRSRRLSAR